MKAYFIGGSADLTCRQMVDDPARLMRQPKSVPFPITDRASPSPVAHVVNEQYRRYDLPDSSGRLIAVYIFQGDDDPFNPTNHR
jgi:hypothetical protein